MDHESRCLRLAMRSVTRADAQPSRPTLLQGRAIHGSSFSVRRGVGVSSDERNGTPLTTLCASRLVLETLTPLPGARKCFRMINGVLVERTVGDILPALQTNADGLKKVLEDLLKQYRSKQDDMEKWKVRAPSIHSY